MALHLSGAPVQDIQTMLNLLSLSHPAIPRLVVDGVFGERTLEAVMVFQRDYNLTVTGVVDNETWQALRAQAELVHRRDGTPIPLQIISPQFTTSSPGDGPEWMFVRTIFQQLSTIVVNFTHGTTNADDGENLKALQQLAQLPVTGTLDRPSWGILVRLYHILVVRGALDPVK